MGYDFKKRGNPKGLRAQPAAVAPPAGDDAKKPQLIGTPAICSVTVEGQKMKYDIAALELEQSVDDHHVLKVTLREVGQAAAGQDFSDAIPYTSFLGKSLSLTITPEGDLVDKSRELQFVGLVSQIELHNSVDAINVATITAHSPTLAMDGARKNAFFFDQSATDIAGAIVRQYPITAGAIEAAPGTLKFCVQYRETDYSFVRRLASDSGLFALYDGREFRIVKAKATDVEELVWRETLGSFTVGWGTASSEFSSRAYNYEQKKTFSQDTKSLPPQAALSQLSRISPEASKNVHSAPGYAASPRLVGDAQTLDRVLQREKGRAQGSMVVCQGQSAVPAVSAGHCVRVSKMDKFDATYFVLSTRHVFDETGSYCNTFVCTPLDIAYPRDFSARNEVTDLQMAAVTDNNDPEHLGRVKVRFAWNDNTETPWIRVMTPHAGKDHGVYLVPEIGDEVLVGFEQDCPDLPVVLGALYNKDDAPQAETNDEKNSIKLFLTRSGNKIVIDDTDGKEKITIVSKDGTNKMVLDSANKAVTLESKGDLTVKCENIKIEATSGLEIKSGADMKIDAGANLKAKAAANCDVEGGAVVNVKGATINLN